MKQRYFWPVAFLLLAILTGPLLILAVPPGHVPDEGNHVLRADSLLHGAVIGHREMRGGEMTEGVVANRALRAVVTLPVRPLDPRVEFVSPVRKWLATEVPWDDAARFVDDGSIAGYVPLFYVPGAMAIGVCRLLGLSPLHAFLAVRMTNFYCFLVIGAAALLVTRRGAALMFCVLMLPMTLSLAASGSQDGLIAACAALAVACLSRAADGRGWYVAAGCLLAAVALGKPPYAALAGLMLLRWRDERLGRRIGAAVLVGLPAVLWAVLEMKVAAVPPLRAAAEAGSLWPGGRPAVFAGPDFGGQMQVLAARPWLAVTLPVGSILESAGRLAREAVGELDWLSLMLPGWLYVAWFVAVPAACCAGGAEKRTRMADRLGVLGCVGGGAVAVGLALYLEWTPVGVPWVAGIQGRYFLPLVMALGLCVPRRGVPVLAVIPVAVAAVDVVVLPGVVAGFYPLG